MAASFPNRVRKNKNVIVGKPTEAECTEQLSDDKIRLQFNYYYKLFKNEYSADISFNHFMQIIFYKLEEDIREKKIDVVLNNEISMLGE